MGTFLVGLCWLIALVNAFPAGSATTLNPLVAIFYPAYTGATADYILRVASIVQTEESLAFLLILGGLVVGMVGYFRKE